jgi:hypothetical protein
MRDHLSGLTRPARSARLFKMPLAFESSRSWAVVVGAMLAMGLSKPWPEALKAMTGEDKMDATAIIDYFAPLKTWLDEQNKK